MHIAAVPAPSGSGVRIVSDSGASFALAAPATVEVLAGDVVERVERGYDAFEEAGGGWEGRAAFDHAGVRYTLTDRWAVDGGSVRVRRRLRAAAGGLPVRLHFEARPEGVGYDELTLFAPPALYAGNDLDGDGVEDYLETRDLVYRDDRLTGLAVLGYAPATGAGYVLAREDRPRFDDIPDRAPGVQHVVQRTDIGALGIVTAEDGSARLVAAYPFVERDRSHALTSEGREPWGAFWPADEPLDLDVEYSLAVATAPSAIDCLWSVWRGRIERLAPEPVELTASLEEITRLRVDALLDYYGEGEARADGIRPAGFVTNCHPQDGRQLENIIQYGFTGQNVLNAHHVLGHESTRDDPEARRKALAVVDFFVAQAAASPDGLAHTLFDLDTGRTANWWSGLVLPLAYAEDGEDLRALMGPVYEHMKYAIEPLRAIDGTYLRCMAEEHAALLRAYEAERDRGVEHPDWLETAARFGAFLLRAQETDGSWRRAYDFDGRPVTEPAAWFGETEWNQKSSTATAVPVLAALHRLTGERRWLDALLRAEAFTARHFVAELRFNGGIHDSIYSRPQLVDSESILFSMRASLTVWELTGDERALGTAVDAARVLATWIYLWDVPLPPSSTLAGHGFRSTGWSACDTCGAGYIHPYEIHAAPDLLQLALAAGDDRLAEIAELVLVGSSETVATSAGDWGYARAGLQEEGLLVSWWLIDDPMFAGTGFGGRGKGEGNKTCLPWISAVGIDAYAESVRRFGTADYAAVRREKRAAIRQG